MSITPTPVGRVLITGGASGLGAAVAAAVTEAGGTPIVLDRDVSSVAEGVAAYRVDVAQTRDAEQAVAQIAHEHGGLEAVVTAAGIDRCGRLTDVAAQEWERVIAVNLLGTAAVVRAALPFLVATHGRVVTVASSLALKAVSDATAYCASKFGVLGFSRALAAETKGEIGVTTLIPAGMKTRFFDDRDAQYRPGPDALLNDPENVANAVVFILRQPPGCEVRELVITHAQEPSWP
ncbi:SDR family oxidoreductase [Rathayibacter toxicus]|uniref:SDR family NAD(P)-dependent oxidoreductase n=1 Tax=Rathayibacter toxicus TaxID=145458 RepID=A0A0U1PUZ8_9MICO|nr:SDR family oxidoreductase [Rathayibacter toxicus]ALS56736.1 short-chain dehydrogenase [Rathayibacter toxicus]KKM46742.1 short-chain dehydrogenase [Rathayibacter toxicus]PPG22477.1 SDR family NAD(P)-dependent oxidoreductase [Rathayibacter toxicus]PPG47198.1 SDR family NAD(P)-dependent oxidoreductase [Rathayibacter toxicus]PPH24455.1 SDR family NAD(P)-dependent oxidoreductase [Rathayibacter toxicus]